MDGFGRPLRLHYNYSDEGYSGYASKIEKEEADVSLSHFSYLFSIILFCGPFLLLFWRKEERILKKYELVLLFAVVVSMPIGLGDYFALEWKVWQFNPHSVLPWRLGGQLESYIVLASLIFVLGSLTLAMASLQDKRQKHRKGSRSQ